MLVQIGRGAENPRISINIKLVKINDKLIVTINDLNVVGGSTHARARTHAHTRTHTHIVMI